MKIALLYGRFCSGGPNAFDIDHLYDMNGKGLTGSESCFFNTARGLAERGHAVQVFADVVQETEAAPVLAGAAAFKLENAHRLDPGVEVVIAMNEPDLLRLVPKTALRIMAQQLNDLNYARPGFDEFVDLYAFPSDTHRQFMVRSCGLNAAKTVVMPNSINLEHFDGAWTPTPEPRRPRSVAYCSSPDRGLHWLLEYWPQIRKRVPDADLRIYYKVQPWLDQVRGLWYDQGIPDWWETAFRARFVEEALLRLGRAGENGVTLVGPIPNTELARELMRTDVLAYPCDPLRWTEGFSVTILDACAAGAVPIISDVDAIGEIYGGVAHVIPGRPQSLDKRWIDSIVHALTDEEWRGSIRRRARNHAVQQGRRTRAAQWEALLSDALKTIAKRAA